MTSILLPSIWLIVLIVGLPQLSETVYTPSLPDIAHALLTTESMTEYTLTIYLFGFAIGTLFWGKFSDKHGRKPCVLAGLFIFIIGCLGCYFSRSIEMLLFSRFIQAFGGSIGSVLGQAICRDAYQGPELGKVYSATGSALALFPALGPLCGGIIAQQFGWTNIFLFLIAFAVIVSFLVILKLPETHLSTQRQPVSFLGTAFRLMRDKKVIGFGLIVAGCNGILFSYFAEGSFYLIKGLNLSPSQYGTSFVVIAAATMAGGMLSRKLHCRYSSNEIMSYGLVIIVFSATFFSSMLILHYSIHALPRGVLILITLFSQMGCAFGGCMATSNALALALAEYKQAIGTASSLFGFFYYCFISVCTFFMGVLHNGTLLPMPLYFLMLGLIMLAIYHVLLKESRIK
jgi:DHA1 family bicyclomycin/chloramphenicol resistance-like MFS transporter